MTRLLVVSAHAADFVWRAGGAIATVTNGGGTAHVVAQSYGERGETGGRLKTPRQTEANVKRIRHDEAARAAAHLGATFEGFDLGDYPLVVDDVAIRRLVDAMTSFAPDVLLTHAERDPFNPDHPVAYAATERARQLASGAGVASAFRTIKPPQFLLFEPHQPELCGFVPTTFLDVTPVFARKEAAMAEMGAQGYLKTYYTERAAHRANHARRISGRSEIQHAEAFMRVMPQVISSW
jgi:4-oxalomesaconate hydratase